MAHANWCGKCECGDCELAMKNECALDLSLPCSPSCELLGADGYPIDFAKCKACGCDAIEEIEIMGIEEE